MVFLCSCVVYMFTYMPAHLHIITSYLCFKFIENGQRFVDYFSFILNIVIICSFSIMTYNFKCGICGLVIRSKRANLQRHVQLHGPIVNRLKCISCQQTLSNQFNFKTHCQRVHPKETISVGFWVKGNAKRKKIIFIFFVLVCTMVQPYNL